MAIVPKFITRFFVRDSDLYLKLQAMLGYTPGKLALYELALCHSSNFKESTHNNERLEFLGDAILGAIIGDYLFKLYPTKSEGFLTDMRSKIVNRKTLNDIGRKIGLKEIMNYNAKDVSLNRSPIFGNALEALIGAIYLDKGFLRAEKFIHQRMLIPYIDLQLIEEQEANTKNKLISWANRENKELEFVDVEAEHKDSIRKFHIAVKIDGDILCTGSASTKKEASKQAAKEAISKLGF